MGSLKNWLESHPAITVLGVALSVGSVSSGVTTYLIEQVNKAEKIETANKFNTQITDLTTRLSSIERRASPNQEKRYLDVQSMQISPSEIRQLPAQFKNFDNGAFFLNAPISQSWTYAILSEGEIGKLGMFKRLTEEAYKNEKLKSLLDLIKTHTWYSNSVADVSFTLGSMSNIQGSLTSHLHIMKVTRQEFAYKAAAAAGLRSRMEKSESKKIDSAIEEIERLKDSDGSDPKNNSTVADTEPDSGIKKTFEQLFDGDTAGLIFVDGLIRMAQLAMLSPNISFSILSAQKQLNVMYIDATLSIADVRIDKSFDAETCKEGESATIVLRRELFFVSYGDGGYIIDVTVPTCDGRSKTFDWVTQWLAGLRIAVKTIK